MDAKITLAFDAQVIHRAKEFASENGISLSRLTEFIYKQMTSKNYKTLEDLPISDWVNMVAEEAPEYGRRTSRKEMKSAFFGAQSHKK